MPITLIGHTSANHEQEGDGQGGRIGRDHIETFARAVEATGFDRLLLPFDVSDPDGWSALQQAAAVTRKIGFVLHNASAPESWDLVAHRRSAPDGRPVDYIRAADPASVPQDSGLVVVPAGSLRDVTRAVRALRRTASRRGWFPALTLHVRPVLAAHQDDAWRRAQHVGSDLFGLGGPMGLVGTPEHVARALLDYYNIGIEHIVVHGFDPLGETAEYGDLIPLLRRKVARRDGLLNMLAG